MPIVYVTRAGAAGPVSRTRAHPNAPARMTTNAIKTTSNGDHFLGFCSSMAIGPTPGRHRPHDYLRVVPGEPLGSARAISRTRLRATRTAEVSTGRSGSKPFGRNM